MLKSGDGQAECELSVTIRAHQIREDLDADKAANKTQELAEQNPGHFMAKIPDAVKKRFESFTKRHDFRGFPMILVQPGVGYNRHVTRCFAMVLQTVTFYC